jgi:magnesium chelatase family protein
VPRVEYHTLTDRRQGERSSQVRERVRLARDRQIKRFVTLPRISANADMGPAEVRTFCTLEAAAEPLLQTASERLQLSARGLHRVLKLARTIADLAGCETIAVSHVAEALQYRPRLDASY